MGAFYDRGIVCYQTKQYKTAEKEFRQELSQLPDSAAAHAMLGMTLVALRKGEQGHKEALEAVRLFPDYAYGHYTLSYTFAATNKPKEAEKAIIEAIRIHPDEAYLFARASQIYLHQKKYQKGLEMADLGLQCEPEHDECLINRGAALLELNRLPEAEEATRAALRVDPESHTAHLNYGTIQLRLFNHAEAFKHYREALRLNPSSEPARLGVIESLKAKNPLYHGLLRFSVFCRSLPPAMVVCSLLLLIIPATRIIIVAIFGAYAVANYMFELALHLDPVGRDFVGDKKSEFIKGLKEVRVPILMVGLGLTVAIGAALAPTKDPNFRSRHKHDKIEKIIDEPVSKLKFKDYKSYMSYVEMRIKRHWEPPHISKTTNTAIQFTVDQDGIVSNGRITESSGNAEMDKAALDALKAASPFPKLPPTGEKAVEVQFHFAYNYKTEGDPGVMAHDDDLDKSVKTDKDPAPSKSTESAKQAAAAQSAKQAAPNKSTGPASKSTKETTKTAASTN
ncbi:MAG: TonB family protein [Cyanobacteria bacterium SZAS-4]|nr:TonB family protein [Cyanobacteria bacterium SZAS-4]